jgi:hypothetical protein
MNTYRFVVDIDVDPVATAVGDEEPLTLPQIAIEVEEAINHGLQVSKLQPGNFRIMNVSAPKMVLP